MKFVLISAIVFVLSCASSTNFIILDRVPEATSSFEIIKVDTIKTHDGNMYKVWTK